MTYVLHHQVKFLVFVLVFGNIGCACRDSFMTFCDSLDDIYTHGIGNWTEVVIGKESPNPSQLRSIDKSAIPLDLFYKLTTLIIIGQFKDLKSYTFGIDPVDAKLDYLQLYGNDLPRIRHSVFDVMKLRKLSLVNNNIEYLHKMAFYNCDIQIYDLSKNNLEQIEREVFFEDSIANVTKEIVIRHNKLAVLQTECFPRSLEVLNLDYNELKTLHYTFFDSLPNLLELTLSHNRFGSVPSIKELRQVRILDFSFNGIVVLTIQDFNNLENLEVLDLGNNKIANGLMFQKFHYPKRNPPLQISLVFNRFTHLVIGNDSFRDHIVLLYGNPWKCQCWDILEQFMVANQVSRNQCDLKHFASGHIPYCVSYEGNDCSQAYPRNPNFTAADADSFVNFIKSKKSNVTCSLVPHPL